jgi:hypothetical protein
MHNFPWNFYPDVNYGVPPPNHQLNPGVIHGDPRFRDSFGFSNVIFPGMAADTPWFRAAQGVLERVLARNTITAAKVVRIKANLLVRSAEPGGPKPFAPHIDLPYPHWAVIFYVNDSDGDTLIFDKTFPDKENAVVVHAVSPKKGRAVLFDGRHYHCGTAPSRHDTRIVINYDFV